MSDGVGIDFTVFDSLITELGEIFESLVNMIFAWQNAFLPLLLMLFVLAMLWAAFQIYDIRRSGDDKFKRLGRDKN